MDNQNFSLFMKSRKRLTKTVMTLLMFLMITTPISVMADDYLRGDVDVDGKVTLADVTSLIDYLLNGTWQDTDTMQLGIQSFTVNGVTFKMVNVEGGVFMMGACDGYSDEQPVHQVTLSDYSIGQTEVTQELWEAVMGSNPSTFKGLSTRPVDGISWDDCQVFIARLNSLTGENFRLPTEAEWEYAARGGKYSKCYLYPGSDNLDEVAWYSSNSFSVTYPVGLKKPNELGLYDMAGELWEWCYDWYGSPYSSEDQVNPVGPETGEYHVIRGGYYSAGTQQCRVSHRGGAWAYSAYCFGLRLVL